MSKPQKHFDPTVLVGLIIAIVCIVGGLILEKGEVKDVTQVTAALIVFGGTIGAVVVSTPKAALMSALRRIPSVLWCPAIEPLEVLDKMATFALIARRAGTMTLDNHMEEVDDRFFRKAMTVLIDGATGHEIRILLETDIDLTERHAEADAKVFDTAGGYAPTIGIIGAVLGLIQVMKHLDQMQEVGRGIAVAFVATVYGVSAANLIFLPLGNKIRSQARAVAKIQEMIMEGAIAIQEGKNPRILRQLLEPYTGVQSKLVPESNTSAHAAAQVESRKAS